MNFGVLYERELIFTTSMHPYEWYCDDAFEFFGNGIKSS